MPSSQLATQILAGRERLGAAAALLSLTRSTGATLGTAAFGGLAFILLQPPQGRMGEGLSLQGVSPERVSHAFHIVFGVLAVFAALAAFAAARASCMDLRKHAAEARR